LRTPGPTTSLTYCGQSTGHDINHAAGKSENSNRLEN
jgi:hypothetical protein